MNSLESAFHSATYPQPLWVRGSLCANPECECRDVFLELLDHADGGGAGHGPPVLEMRVDTETWQEVDAPKRPAPLEALAREFLREYSAGARAAWQAEVERRGARLGVCGSTASICGRWKPARWSSSETSCPRREASPPGGR